MRLRHRLFAVVALVLGAAPVPQALAQGGADADALPIVDVHFHIKPFMTPDELRAQMDRHNFKRHAGGAVPTPDLNPVQRVRQFREALGDRYLYFTGQIPALAAFRAGGVQALNDPNHPAFVEMLNRVESDLRTGARGIGEIHVIATYAPDMWRRNLAGNGPLVKAMWTLAAKYKVPLLLHHEFGATSTSMKDLDNLLTTSDPAVRLILGHCGSVTTPDQVRPFLEKYPNVVCDLTFRSPPLARNRQQVIFDSSGIRSDWKQLIEAFPDRFSTGIDDVNNWKEYDETAAMIRKGLLAQLTPATARAVAYENASRWIGMD